MTFNIYKASTDTSRKIGTLRRWAVRGVRRVEYLSEIADEMEHVYRTMIRARRCLMLIEKYPNNRRVAKIATYGLITKNKS